MKTIENQASKLEAIKNIANADIDTAENDYIIKCLQAAVAYCKEQFESSCSEVDALPSINSVSKELKEADKFGILEEYLSNFIF